MTGPPTFTAVTAVGAEGARIGLVTCQLCGATILIDPRDDSNAIALHIMWHEKHKEGLTIV